MKRSLLITLLSLQTLIASAQVFLHVDTFWMSPTTSSYNQNATVYIKLVNTGDSSANNLVEYMMQVNTGAPFLLGVDTLNNLTTGDSVSYYTNSFSYNGALFSPGNNIVVVWPIWQSGGGGVLSDSASLNVTILSGAGMKERSGDHMNCFPSVARPGRNLQCVMMFEEVRIYSLSGQLILHQKGKSQTIKLPDFLADGIYFIETNHEGIRTRQKIVVSD